MIHNYRDIIDGGFGAMVIHNFRDIMDGEEGPIHNVPGIIDGEQGRILMCWDYTSYNSRFYL